MTSGKSIAGIGTRSPQQQANLIGLRLTTKDTVNHFGPDIVYND